MLYLAYNVLGDVAKTMAGRDDYKILVLEDNLETTKRMSPHTVDKVSEFLEKKSGPDGFDVFPFSVYDVRSWSVFERRQRRKC